ncbi:Est1 DNA/RNA binding domain [Teratosphaeria destructans]|uniref:Est1 DNA/RNA binding domain n=1 Tax=Teratosphaeria destructans TaxID=418781 RepID=A0A9W7W3V3_9PEZI|nr:Est1 DNA/RNA binding domain [Teratosphaeria destructans]
MKETRVQSGASPSSSPRDHWFDERSTMYPAGLEGVGRATSPQPSASSPSPPPSLDGHGASRRLSPQPLDPAEAASSDESMNNNGTVEYTPPESPAAEGPPASKRGRGLLHAGGHHAADHGLSCQPDTPVAGVRYAAASRGSRASAPSRQRRGLRQNYAPRYGRISADCGETGPHEPLKRPKQRQQCSPTPRDFGHGSVHSDRSTMATSNIPAGVQWSGMMLQPDSSPISQEQLSIEIQGIYAGLVNVEARCINIDAAQSDSKSSLSQEEWQALIALHRTLLYEHHDFLMATQHPSANGELRGLAAKFSMPARMWKHGIHAFLEVLRHHRPASQDHMLAFIYLSYQMMALLYETVSSFTDTWIECLGDLARYRMAIEEDRELHSQWGGVAASWYTKAADRNPEVGRLYHHLGILECPSLRKFACYGKSLTCKVAFPNAMDSMKALCEPILEEGLPQRSSVHLTEATFCRFHAQIFLGKPVPEVKTTYDALVANFAKAGTFRWIPCGVPLAITNISALFQFGRPSNPLRRTCDYALQSQTSTTEAVEPFSVQPATASATTTLLDLARDATLLSLHTALQCQPDPKSIQEVLPFLHTMLSFLHSLYRVSPLNHDALGLLQGVQWNVLVTFVNSLARLEPITARVEQCAKARIWLQPDSDGREKVLRKALPEDYHVRGLVWASGFFGADWFEQDVDKHSRAIETIGTTKQRAERMLYWALRLAFETDILSYDPTTRTFTVANAALDTKSSTTAKRIIVHSCTEAASTPSHTSESMPSSNSPQASSSDGEFVHVGMPSSPESALSTETNKTTSKRSSPAPLSYGIKAKKRMIRRRVDADDFRIAGQN